MWGDIYLQLLGFPITRNNMKLIGPFKFKKYID